MLARLILIHSGLSEARPAPKDRPLNGNMRNSATMMDFRCGGKSCCISRQLDLQTSLPVPTPERDLAERYGIEIIAPHRGMRQTPTQDGRPLRRYRRRW